MFLFNGILENRYRTTVGLPSLSPHYRSRSIDKRRIRPVLRVYIICQVILCTMYNTNERHRPNRLPTKYNSCGIYVGRKRWSDYRGNVVYVRFLCGVCAVTVTKSLRSTGGVRYGFRNCPRNDEVVVRYYTFVGRKRFDTFWRRDITILSKHRDDFFFFFSAKFKELWSTRKNSFWVQFLNHIFTAR